MRGFQDSGEVVGRRLGLTSTWLLPTDVWEELAITVKGYEMEAAFPFETFLPASRPHFVNREDRSTNR